MSVLYEHMRKTTQVRVTTDDVHTCTLTHNVSKTYQKTKELNLGLINCTPSVVLCVEKFKRLST